MRKAAPPLVAAWLLEHLTIGPRNEALVGDLCEEFRSGRSTGWYWRQVTLAIAVGIYRAIGNYGAAALFALMWSMLAPAWVLIVAGVEQQWDLNARFYRMNWPWSTVCDLGALLLADLIFIWIGVVLYQVPYLLRRKVGRLRQISRGVAACIPVLMVVSAALIAMPKYFIALEGSSRPSLGPVSAYAITQLNPPEVRRLAPQEEWSAQFGDPVIEPGVNPIAAITDVRNFSVLLRLPFFLVVLCALWRMRSSEDNEQEDFSS